MSKLKIIFRRNNLEEYNKDLKKLFTNFLTNDSHKNQLLEGTFNQNLFFYELFASLINLNNKNYSNIRMYINYFYSNLKDNLCSVKYNEEDCSKYNLLHNF